MPNTIRIHRVLRAAHEKVYRVSWSGGDGEVAV